MRFSMLYSREQILSFKSCLVFYAGDSFSNLGYLMPDLRVRAMKQSEIWAFWRNQE